jgi:hypothetical protein
MGAVEIFSNLAAAFPQISVRMSNRIECVAELELRTPANRASDVPPRGQQSGVGVGDSTRVERRGSRRCADRYALGVARPRTGLDTFNGDWKETRQSAIEATGLAPTDDRESVILATLTPDNYTAIVRGKNGTTGVALVEVYNFGP